MTKTKFESIVPRDAKLGTQDIWTHDAKPKTLDPRLKTILLSESIFRVVREIPAQNATA